MALLYALHDDWLYSFERVDKWSASVFGGPLNAEVGGKSFGPKPMHLVASLGSWHIPALGEARLTELPLIYGMHYAGCNMLYRVEFRHQIELLNLSPPFSSDDCPYPNFPPLLPYMPLRLE